MTISQTTVMRGLGGMIILILPLFLFAGRINYWQGWLFVGALLASMLANAFIVKADLVEERFNPGKGVKNWDKLILGAMTVLYIAMLVTGGLDSGRYNWSGAQPWWVYALGLVLYAAGQVFFLWAKATNRWFSSVVRLQTDRSQVVCQDGPYRLVRHPGYVGGLLYGLGMALLLGSLWALIPQIIAAILLVVRTALEDRMLKAELPGYGEYSRKVKRRLIPGVW
jgi:protein-S-isoprenylcysteine O-methyltransferase Ste14